MLLFIHKGSKLKTATYLLALFALYTGSNCSFLLRTRMKIWDYLVASAWSSAQTRVHFLQQSWQVYQLYFLAQHLKKKIQTALPSLTGSSP